MYKAISILTATRAVTTNSQRGGRVHEDFNPHRHKGGDQQTQYDSDIGRDFNPHRHKGGDPIYLQISLCLMISILTATRAVTKF